MDILRLKFQAKLSNEKISRACGVSKGVVCKYLHLAEARGIGWHAPEGTDEAQIVRLLFPAVQPPSRFVEPHCFVIHQELKRKGVTLQLLWAEYVSVHEAAACRYSQYCHRCRLWRPRYWQGLNGDRKMNIGIKLVYVACLILASTAAAAGCVG